MAANSEAGWCTLAPWLLLALAVLQVAIAWSNRDPALINPDSAQLVTAARNMLEGRGFVTSALYYEEQHALGNPPVPLTIWPPGFAVSMVPFMIAGFSGPNAAFAASGIGLVLTVMLSYCLAAAAGLRTGLALLVGCAVALLAHLGILVVKSLSEPLFVAATLASASLLVTADASSRPLRRLALAGACAALAFLVRYAGIAWVATGLATIVLLDRGYGLRVLVARVLSFGVLPIAVVGVLFARNLMLVGSLTGGPALGGDTSIRAVLQDDYWSTLRLFGAFDNPGEPILAGLLGCLGIWALFRAFRVVRFPPMGIVGPGGSGPTDRAVVLCVAYGASTLLLLAYLSFKTYPGLVQERYLVPLVPFGFLLAAALTQAFDGQVARVGAVARSLRMAALAVVAIGYAIGQRGVAVDEHKVRAAHAQVALAADIRRESIDRQPLADYLKRQITFESPLTADDGQALAALLGIAVIGLPEPLYTRKTWNELEVRKLMQDMNSCLLLVHPRTLGPGRTSRPVFLRELAEGRRVDWLDVVIHTPRLHLYRASWCQRAPIRRD